MEFNETDLKRIDDRIRVLRQAAEDLRKEGERIPAVERNARRILGGIDMLERNICDLLDPTTPWSQ